MLSRFWTFMISFAFCSFPYISVIMNAASLTTLFKHIRGNVEEQNSDDLSRVKDLIREKVINFVRDKVRNHVIGYFVVSLIQK